MIELVIIVVAVIMLIMIIYSFFASNLDANTQILTEKHKNDRLLFVCTFLPRIYIDGLNRTIGEVLSSTISTGEYMVYYGRESTPVNSTLLVEQILDPYLDEGYWQLKLTEDMRIGSDIPMGVDPKLCRIQMPLIAFKGNVTNIYLYRW